MAVSLSPTHRNPELPARLAGLASGSILALFIDGLAAPTVGLFRVPRNRWAHVHLDVERSSFAAMYIMARDPQVQCDKQRLIASLYGMIGLREGLVYLAVSEIRPKRKTASLFVPY